ncbi:MAG: ankyrin repeat domain-containing protein, partial [Thermoanaerobaculia bacterium]
DPEIRVAGRGTPLIRAAASGHVEVVRELLDAGADPDAAVEGDGNPLIAAAAGGHLEVLRLLVESGGDMDRVVPGDENPLIQAAANGHLEVVRYLLDQGADPNVRVEIPPTSWRPEGEVRTPLAMARRGGHEAVVRLLQEHGANAAVYLEPVEPEAEELLSQLLVSYELNPRTVVLAGYSDDRLGHRGTGLTRTGRTFFLKLGYAWLL